MTTRRSKIDSYSVACPSIPRVAVAMTKERA